MKVCRYCSKTGFKRPNSEVCYDCMPTGLTEVQRRMVRARLERKLNPIILDCPICSKKFELPFGEVNRKYCFECVPKGLTKEKAMKILRIHGKRKMVEMMGGKCFACGFNKYLASLEFHHLEEDSKEFNIGNRITGFHLSEDMLKELEKCILLCSNCHRAYHSGELKLNLKF